MSGAPHKRWIKTPPGYPDFYLFSGASHSLCVVCGERYRWPKAAPGHTWRDILYCSTGCYTRHLVKFGDPKTARPTLTVTFFVDQLPGCRLPCSQCGKHFDPDMKTVWVEEGGGKAGALPMCSAVCFEAYDVKIALLQQEKAIK